jgi:hypothetical protein
MNSSYTPYLIKWKFIGVGLACSEGILWTWLTSDCQYIDDKRLAPNVIIFSTECNSRPCLATMFKMINELMVRDPSTSVNESTNQIITNYMRSGWTQKLIYQVWKWYTYVTMTCPNSSCNWHTHTEFLTFILMMIS